MDIFVRNLPSGAAEADLNVAFGRYGTVRSSAVIRDRSTGASRGFGFVEMPEGPEAEAAIAGLNGQETGGQALLVRPARSSPERIARAYRRVGGAPGGEPPALSLD